MTIKTVLKLALICTFVFINAQANTITFDKNDAYFQQKTNTTSKKQHFVQFLSTINATKAEGIKNTLLIQGFPAFVNISTQPKKSYYQVQIGPFASQGIAQQAKVKVVQQYPEHSFLNTAILKSRL